MAAGGEKQHPLRWHIHCFQTHGKRKEMGGYILDTALLCSSLQLSPGRRCVSSSHGHRMRPEQQHWHHRRSTE